MAVIGPHARCTLCRLPLHLLSIYEVRPRSLAWVAHYTALLLAQPKDDAGFLIVEPQSGGRYAVIDGQTRYLALIIAGRADARCIVVEDDGGRRYGG